MTKIPAPAPGSGKGASALCFDQGEPQSQRQIDMLSRQAVGATSGAAERALQSVQRRIDSAVDGKATGGRRSSVSAAHGKEGSGAALPVRKC